MRSREFLADAGAVELTKNPDALMELRRELGRYIEGSRSTLPVLSVGPGPHPKSANYLNFQNPVGPPAADPLVVNGKIYMKSRLGRL